jgi:hypothetical protein
VARALEVIGGSTVMEDCKDAAVIDSLSRLLSGGAKARNRDLCGAAEVALSVESSEEHEEAADDVDEDKISSSTSRFSSSRSRGIGFGVPKCEPVRPRGDMLEGILLWFGFERNGFVNS